MDDQQLLKQIIKEKYQIIDHRQDGELHQYIDDNADDLVSLLDQCIRAIALKGVEKNAA